MPRLAFIKSLRSLLPQSVLENWNQIATALGEQTQAKAANRIVILDSAYGLEPGHVVILDNSSAYKVKGVRLLVESRGAQLLYLPPYSPDFNPIEQTWAKLKQRLRGIKARALEQLEPAIA